MVDLGDILGLFPDLTLKVIRVELQELFLIDISGYDYDLYGENKQDI